MEAEVTGFETGTAAPWSAGTGVISNHTQEPPHTGKWDAWLDGYGKTHTDTLSQTVTLPTGCSNYNLSFWLHIDTAETSTTVHKYCDGLEADSVASRAVRRREIPSTGIHSPRDTAGVALAGGRAPGGWVDLDDDWCPSRRRDPDRHRPGPGPG
jgi:hypothetical protein